MPEHPRPPSSEAGRAAERVVGSGGQCQGPAPSWNKPQDTPGRTEPAASPYSPRGLIFLAQSRDSHTEIGGVQ